MTVDPWHPVYMSRAAAKAVCLNPMLNVLKGFAAKTASSNHQEQCVEDRRMNVTFQSGAMVLQLSVQKMCTRKMEALEGVTAIAIK